LPAPALARTPLGTASTAAEGGVLAHPVAELLLLLLHAGDRDQIDRIARSEAGEHFGEVPIGDADPHVAQLGAGRTAHEHDAGARAVRGTRQIRGGDRRGGPDRTAGRIAPPMLASGGLSLRGAPTPIAAAPARVALLAPAGAQPTAERLGIEAEHGADRDDVFEGHDRGVRHGDDPGPP